MIVLIWIVLLVIGEEGVELEALLEVLCGLKASNVLEHVEVAVGVGAGLNKTVPVHALQTNVRIVLLEAEVHGRVEPDVWPLNSVHILTRHLKLTEVEVFREHLHLSLINKKNLLNQL